MSVQGSVFLANPCLKPKGGLRVPKHIICIWVENITGLEISFWFPFSYSNFSLPHLAFVRKPEGLPSEIGKCPGWGGKREQFRHREQRKRHGEVRLRFSLKELAWCSPIAENQSKAKRRVWTQSAPHTTEPWMNLKQTNNFTSSHWSRGEEYPGNRHVRKLGFIVWGARCKTLERLKLDLQSIDTCWIEIDFLSSFMEMNWAKMKYPWNFSFQLLYLQNEKKKKSCTHACAFIPCK